MSMLGWPSLSAMRPEGGEAGIKMHGRMGKERQEGKEADPRYSHRATKREIHLTKTPHGVKSITDTRRVRQLNLNRP